MAIHAESIKIKLGSILQQITSVKGATPTQTIWFLNQQLQNTGLNAVLVEHYFSFLTVVQTYWRSVSVERRAVELWFSEDYFKKYQLSVTSNCFN